MCVCVVVYAEGAGLMQGKALASAVVVHFPPERSSLSLHGQLSLLLSFLEEAFRSP